MNSNRNNKNKPRSQRKKRTKRSKPTPKRKQTLTYIRMSECAASYMRALCDPFSSIDPLPCIPDAITLPSYKMRVVTRGVAYVGASGFGAAIADPWSSPWNDNGPNDPPLLLSNASNAWTAATFLPAVTSTDWSQAHSNSLFAFTTLNQPMVNLRLVAGGLRIRYTGTTLNEGGQVAVTRVPSNITMIGNTPLFLENMANTSVAPVSRKGNFVNYYPDALGTLSYNSVTAFSHGGGFGDQYPIGFVFTGTPGNSFYVELVTYFEVIGTTFPQTASQLDTVGYSAVMNAAQSIAPPLGTPAAWYSNVLSRLSGSFIDGVSTVATQLGTAAANTAVHLAIAGGRRATRTLEL